MSLLDGGITATPDPGPPPEYEFHPVCEAFNEYEPAVYADRLEYYRKHPDQLDEGEAWLAEDPADCREKVADGRHYLRLCRDLGRTPRFRWFAGTAAELAEFVLVRNAHRRHQNPSQLGMSVALVHDWARGNNQHAAVGQTGEQTARAVSSATQKEVSKKAGVSEDTLQRANAVKRNAPELVPLVRDGRLDVKTAAQVAGLAEPKRRAVATAPDPKATARKLLADKRYPPTRPHPPAAPKANPAAAETVVCPLIDPATGSHWASGECSICQGRGRITPAELEAAPEEVREHARKAANGQVPNPEVDIPPAHPFAHVMAKVTGTVRLITQEINKPENERLKSYLARCGLIDTRTRIINGNRYGPRFIGFKNLRWVIEQAGRPGPELATEQVRAGYTDEGEDDQA